MQMTVTWTSGYGKKEAEALVQWGPEEGKEARLSPATTLTFTRHDMCGRSLPCFSTCSFSFADLSFAGHLTYQKSGVELNLETCSSF